MQQRFHHLLFVLPLVVLGLFSCKREFDKPRWDTQVLAPLVKSKLTIRNIIKDTSSIRTEADNSITLVHRVQIFNYSIDSLITLSAPPFKRTAKLSSLVLDNQTITRRISLGEIAKQLQAQGNTQLAQLIYAGHIAGKAGQKFDVSDIDNIMTGPIDIDINQFFQTATLLTGEMSVSLYNGLPLNISRIEFGLNNKNPASIITAQTFTNVLPNTTQQSSINLAGKTVSGNIQASVNDMDIEGGRVLIDTSNALLLTISISNIKVESATAIFPAQNVIDTTTIVGLLDMKDILLTKATIREGTVDADVTSTADDNLYMTYKIPKSVRNGVPFQLDAAIPVNAQHYTVTSNFSGFDMDLRGPDGDQFNQFANILIARLNYTGRAASLSLQDSLDITLTFQNAKPSYVKGYLGQSTMAIGPGNVDIDIFKNISVSTLNFKSAKMNIVLENSLGVPSQVVLKELKVFNTPKNTSQVLTGIVANDVHTINPAIETSTKPVSTVIDLSTGTNAVDLLNILPDKLSYEGTFEINPAGNTGTYTDFARSDVDLKAYVELQLPLSLIASNLLLSDTSEFSAANLKTSGLQSGIFNLHIWNGFPLNANAQIYFLDASGMKLDSITSVNPIQAPALDPNTGRVTAPTYSVIPFTLTEARMNTLVQHSTQVLFTARFDTVPAGTHVSIYNDYAVDFKLVGGMTIQVNSGQ